MCSIVTEGTHLKTIRRANRHQQDTARTEPSTGAVNAPPEHASMPIKARNVGEPALKLSARAFELPNNRPALIETDKMETILPEIDADRADGGGWCGFVGHGACSLCFSIPHKTLRLAGREHGRAIPLGDICTAAKIVAIRSPRRRGRAASAAG